MRLSFLAFLVVSFVITSGSMAQSVKDQTGFTQLARKIGTLPDGAGLSVAQVEALSGGGYLPANTAQFAGKTITDGSGTSSTISAHASGVGIRYFGNTFSTSGGITDITGYDANDYLIRVTGAGTGTDPLPDSFDITNHSYIANGVEADAKFAILSRVDFVVNRDNTITVVGANNSGATPDLVAPAYNAITVGATDGGHSRTSTTDYGAPRTKPDIVAPEAFTSSSTPWVSSAAAMLLDAAQGTNGAENEAVRAMLFAGATKEEFAVWERTPSRPIDETFGFGELNVYNSYMIVDGGEFDGQTSDPTANVGPFGYDFATFDGSNDLFYDFEIANESIVSAVLTWNAEIIDTNPSNFFAPVLSVADLDLRIYDSSGSFLGSLLDESISTDYNHEHIYFDNLAAGQYTLRVSGDSAVDFGLAWRMQQVGTVAPVIDTVELNVGESQRSAVETVTITFEEGDIVVVPASDFVMQRSTQTEETFETVESNSSTQLNNDLAVFTINFDSHVRNADNALVDGNYQLTLPRTRVLKNGVPMSEDFVFGDQEAHAFYSLYGDADGNRSLNVIDLLAFRGSFGMAPGMPGYEFFMDYQADGAVNVFDLLEFRSRFLTTMPFTFNSSIKASQSRLQIGSNLIQEKGEKRVQKVQPQIPMATIDLKF